MIRKRTPRPPLHLTSACCKSAWSQGYESAQTAHGSPGGRKGGRSTSEAKKRAARENGRKGGAAKKKSGTSPNESGSTAHGPKNS